MKRININHLIAYLQTLPEEQKSLQINSIGSFTFDENNTRKRQFVLHTGDITNSTDIHIPTEYDDLMKLIDKTNRIKILTEGIKHNIIKFTHEGEGEIVCRIGEYWFYFAPENVDVHTDWLYRNCDETQGLGYSEPEIAQWIYTAIEDLAAVEPDPNDCPERDYYYAYLSEQLSQINV